MAVKRCLHFGGHTEKNKRSAGNRYIKRLHVYMLFLFRNTLTGCFL